MSAPDVTAHLRVALLMFLASWVTLLSWRSLSLDYSEVSMPLLGVGAVVVATGGAGRALRLSPALVVLVQLALTAATVLASVAGSPLPTPDTLDRFMTAMAEGARSAQLYAAPVPTDVPPVHPLLLVGGAAIVLLVDLFAATMGRVPVAGLALLAAYTVPVTVTGEGVSWWIFVAAAGLFLAALYVQHGDRIGRWGRSPADERSGFSVRSTPSGAPAVAIGAASTALALAVPLAVPTMNLALFEGSGPGTRQIKVEDPMVDLRRDLQRGRDIPLLWVTTDGNRPDYLRLSVLTRFSGDRWTPGDRDIPEDQVASGPMPGLDGVSLALPRRESSYSVRVSRDFESTWLPTSAQVSRINAGEDWRYDLATRDFIAAEDDVTTAGRSYGFTGVEVAYDATSMDDSVSGGSAVPARFTEVPSTLNNEIRRLAASVTADAPTRFQKAQVLQDWFREDGGFVYDINAVDDVDDGGADLMAFLDEDTGRVGYCEQFAASMAIMARTLGIPARVAVGFLQPRTAGVGTWEFSAWDLHAWPELYFPGSGWVRFEPTPQARAGDVPAYTVADVAEETAAPLPSASQSTELLPERAGEQPEDEAAAADESGSAVPWRLVVGVGLTLLVAAGLLLAPRTVRRARRRARRAGGVEELWDELRDVVVDLGHRWPAGRSPRRVRRIMEQLLARPVPRSERSDRPRRGPGQAPEAAAALHRLVDRLERSRYARGSTELSEGELRGLWSDLELVEEALAGGVSTRVERRAEWWPRSVLSSARSTSVQASGPRRRETAGSTGEEPVQRREELVH